MPALFFSPNALHGNFISSDINISPSVELLVLKKKKKKEKAKYICSFNGMIGNN